MELRLFIRNHRGGLILLVLLLPLCFLGIRNNHDWGDDFAQYINQAKCIAEGKPASATGYIYNDNYPMLGPAAYPGGFPLLLAPVYAFFGNGIPVLNVYISLWLIAAGFIWYMVLRRYHSELVAVLLSLLWCWHPWALEFKAEIMAEIPFTALMGLLILLYQRGFMEYSTGAKGKSVLKIVVVGVIAGLLLALRMNGIAVIAALLAYDVWKQVSARTFKNIGNTAIVLAVTLFISLFLVNYLISGIAVKELLTYGSNFKGESLWATIRENLYYYTWLVQDFFQRSKPAWKVFPLITQALVLAIALIGIIKQTITKRPLLLWVFAAWMALLLFYPYRGSGFRFLLPVVPIILHFGVEGFKSIRWDFKLPKWGWALGLFGVIQLQFLPEQVSAIKNAKNNFEGPQQAESTEAFEYIKANTPANAVFLFKKPRALALYAGRSAFAVKPADTMAVANDAERFNATYILIHTELGDKPAQLYIEKQQNVWQLVWGNNKFTLYAKNPR